MLFDTTKGLSEFLQSDGDTFFIGIKHKAPHAIQKSVSAVAKRFPHLMVTTETQYQANYRHEWVSPGLSRKRVRVNKVLRDTD